eukprot:m.189368 g.189368  ORF g.189368 m.189368 type:complete len:384 (+) comp18205_c0_seq3:1457-2608(+)
MAFARDHTLFSWGNGEMGKLGTGDEDDRVVPVRIDLPNAQGQVVQLVCGPDATMALSEYGVVLAWGNNEHNKLGLNAKAGVLARWRAQAKSKQLEVGIEVGSVRVGLLPKVVQSLRPYRIQRLAVGASHAAFVDNNGRVITLGSNTHGQRGSGGTECKLRPVVVSDALLGEKVTDVACGDSFTLASTSSNTLFGWGSTQHVRLGESVGVANVPTPRQLLENLRVSCLSTRGALTAVLTEEVKESHVARHVSDTEIAASTTASVSNTLDQVDTLTSISELTADDSDDDDDIPSWLAAEVADAAFIADNTLQRSEHASAVTTETNLQVPTPVASNDNQLQPSSVDQDGQRCGGCSNDQHDRVASLLARIALLETLLQEHGIELPP